MGRYKTSSPKSDMYGEKTELMLKLIQLLVNKEKISKERELKWKEYFKVQTQYKNIIKEKRPVEKRIVEIEEVLNGKQRT